MAWNELVSLSLIDEVIMFGTHYRARTSRRKLASVNEGPDIFVWLELEWYHDKVRFY